MPAKYKFPRLAWARALPAAAARWYQNTAWAGSGVDPAPGLVQQADVALGGVVPGLGLWQPLLEGASEVLRFIGSDAGGKVGVCRAVAQENGKASRANG